ncbi:MAG TPA: DUF5691 domain-containing protein [Ktedonobacteraceae bacterium]|jgi:hypothetical protein
MDSLVTTALVGLARQEKVNLDTGTPIDDLLAALPGTEIERKFLLCAGAQALYYQAGLQARQGVQTPEPAGAEQLRACTPGAALLLSRLLSGEQRELLPEALARLRQHGLRLPYALLPQALQVTNKETQAALVPVLGERGRWLGQFNSSWNWVQQFLPEDENCLPPDAETIWQEGPVGQRIEILRRLRRIDPQQARTWLEGVWKQEKAEMRNDLLASLEIGLCAADEAFLEAALDDRAASVRSMAAAMLTRLPHSALCQRMRQRAQNMIKLQAGKLVVTPPQELKKDWQHDGVLEKPPQKVAPRSWWLIQVCSVIEPTFWEAHLEAPPAELFAQLANNRWETQVMQGWSRAAMHYHTSGWVMPLWHWWRIHHKGLEKKHLASSTYREQLLKHMPAQEAERAMLELLQEGQDKPDDDCWELLAEVPRPWSGEFARTYLQLLRQHCPVQKITAESFNPYADPWISELPALALALPSDCFNAVMHLWELPEDQRWGIQYIREQMKECIATMHMRQKIEEEID